MKKIKIKYALVVGIFLIIIIIGAYLVIDYENDKRYLESQGFEKSTRVMRTFFTGYDNYCEPPSQTDEPTVACEIMYGSTLMSPFFSININFGDDTLMTYSKEKRGFPKKEITFVSIMNIEDLSMDGAYCQVEDDFSVIENDVNNAFCYTDEYTEYINSHKEYIDDALGKYNTYYNNFNMARAYW